MAKTTTTKRERKPLGPLPEHQCDRCDAFPYDTQDELDAHVLAFHIAPEFARARDEAERTPTAAETQQAIVADMARTTLDNGRFERVPNGFGGTTTRRVDTPQRRSGGPTKKQTAFVRTLLDERAGNEAAEGIRQALNNARTSGQLTGATVSAAIEGLLAIRTERPQSQAPQGPACNVGDIPDGRYAFTTDAGHTGFCKVKNGRSRVFVNLLVGSVGSLRIQELPNGQQLAILRKIMAAGVMESAARYGHEIEACGQCGSPLTLERSRKAGYGEKCASNRGWGW